jgi:hypothetical protein
MTRRTPAGRKSENGFHGRNTYALLSKKAAGGVSNGEKQNDRTPKQVGGRSLKRATAPFGAVD